LKCNVDGKGRILYKVRRKRTKIGRKRYAHSDIDVDLASLGGKERAISRKHCELIVECEELDKNEPDITILMRNYGKNGTKIIKNDGVVIKLDQPFQETVVENGNRIQIANVTMEILIKRIIPL
jgi:hypothetical protein